MMKREAETAGVVTQKTREIIEHGGYMWTLEPESLG